MNMAQYKRYLLQQIRKDYELFLVENKFTAEMVKVVVEDISDQVPMPKDWTNLELRKSLIHGDGNFLVIDMEAGTLVAPARLSGKRTPAGRYTNHSPAPNAVFERDGEDINLILTRNVSAGEEITVNYRQAGQVR